MRAPKDPRLAKFVARLDRATGAPPRFDKQAASLRRKVGHVHVAAPSIVKRSTKRSVGKTTTEQ